MNKYLICKGFLAAFFSLFLVNCADYDESMQAQPAIENLNAAKEEDDKFKEGMSEIGDIKDEVDKAQGIGEAIGENVIVPAAALAIKAGKKITGFAKDKLVEAMDYLSSRNQPVPDVLKSAIKNAKK